MTNQKILIVDDELHLVHILSYKLKQLGYDLVTAHNGRDGLQMACKHKVDLVVTDYQMPVMDGFNMAVELRANTDTAHVPVIMLTARGHKIPPSELAKTNVKSLMAKPFSAKQLAENIVELIGDCHANQINQADNPSGGGHAA